MNILQVENASFAVGHVALLDHAAFQLDSGEKIGLIGRNGAGKSTFLKILAGVQKLDDGQVIIQNGLKIVYVPQEPLFDANISVFDAVSEGLGGLRDVLRRYHQISHALESSQDGALLKELNELQSQIETQEGWQFDAAISQTISELGLPESTLIGNLSGGQKKRVALAQAWVQKPDILLLDEPTNHLDIDAIIWLENLLKQFSGSMVVITHDRRFLDNTATRIVELDRGILRSYPGSFSKYSEKKAEELAVEAEHNRLFDKFHAQEEAWIRKGIEARRTRNEGRVKRLEDLRRQRAERRNVQGQVNFKLAAGEKSGKIIAELEHASFQYGDKVIMDKFSTVIQRGDKIGLIGPNGIGKTTFLKLILGELQPTFGKIRLGSKPQSVMAGEPALHTLRRCYDHMAGRQGVALTQALLAQQKLLADAANGRFVITDAGRLWLETLDIAASQPHTAWCMDWTEQVPHIAGWLGAALFDAFAARSYVHASATAPRVLRLTEKGRAFLAREFGLAA